VLRFDSRYRKEDADSEHPQHRVKITRPFYLGTYEVTKGQFRSPDALLPKNDVSDLPSRPMRPGATKKAKERVTGSCGAPIDLGMARGTRHIAADIPN
jgi:hypothetical protein